MSKYTPGPWEWGNGWNDIGETVYKDEDDSLQKYMSLQLFGKDDVEIIPIRIDHYDVIYDGEPIWEADRNLIAAAPELLEVLREVENTFYPQTEAERMLLETVTLTIAKAEGNNG